MDFLFASLFWILGLVVGSFGIVQIMTVLFFSIPFTRQLNRLGLLKNTGKIYKMDIATFAIWTLIIVGISTLVYLYASQLSLIFYLIGIGITFFMGLGQTGTNDNNLQDYFTANHRLINIAGLNNVDEKFGTVILDYLDKVYKEKGI